MLIQTMWTAVVILAAVGPAWAVQAEDSWGAKLPDSENHFGGGSATDGTYLYRFGGSNSVVPVNPGTLQSSMRRFDPTANQWSTLTAMPAATTYNRGAFSGTDRIYSFGGWTLADGPIYRYSISADTWTTVGALTSGSQYYQMAAANLGGRIHLVAGYLGTGPSDIHLQFDPSTEATTGRASPPAALYDPGCAVLGGRLWMLGGINGSSLATCYSYDPGSNTWATRAPMSIDGAPHLRWGIRAFATRGRLYACGGYDNASTGAAFGPTNRVLEYAPVANTWTPRTSMVAARHGHVAEAISGKGDGAGGPDNTCEEYTPMSNGGAPDPAAEVRQLSTAYEIPQGGWGGRQIRFSGTVTDPDGGEDVVFEVQVKRGTADWSTATTLSSGPVPQGLVTIPWTAPAEGDYDWRFRVVDEAGNETPDPDGGPPAWTEFMENTVTPDFRTDHFPPEAPAAESPRGAVEIDNAERGTVHFSWGLAADAGSGNCTYEILVSRDPGGLDLAASASGLPVTSFSADLTPSGAHYWRVRGMDQAGNLGPWSEIVQFLVVFGSGGGGDGDGRKNCGMAAPAGGCAAGPAFLLVLAPALWVRRRAKPWNA